jgi:hypothetical protein
VAEEAAEEAAFSGYDSMVMDGAAQAMVKHLSATGDCLGSAIGGWALTDAQRDTEEAETGGGETGYIQGITNKARNRVERE